VGALRLTYNQREEALEKSSLFVVGGLEVNGVSEKKRVRTYRYGFNGQERDNEWKGEGNSYDFGARIYDPRLGRWLSVDPLQVEYPGMSSYNFVGNNPIIYVDPDGRKIELSKLTATQLTRYNAMLEVLSESELFAYYYEQLLASDIVYSIQGTGHYGEKELGGYYDPKTHTVDVGSEQFMYVMAQELFHAYQDDGKFYEGYKPKPYSTIETEGDVLTLYVVMNVQGGGGFSLNQWIMEIFMEATQDLPSSDEVGSDEYQKMFQKAVNARIAYYTQLNLDAPTYTAPNTGVGPIALEALMGGVEEYGSREKETPIQMSSKEIPNL
jgi:RHS repeat-associated protein